jgi:hypothetical protein
MHRLAQKLFLSRNLNIHSFFSFRDSLICPAGLTVPLQMRVLKLAQSWTTMKVLLSIIISTLGALGNLTFILLIVIYIFAILGMQLFGKDYTAENFYPDKVPRSLSPDTGSASPAINLTICHLGPFQMELHRLLPLLHDDFPHPVRRVDRAAVGLYAHTEETGKKSDTVT